MIHIYVNTTQFNVDSQESEGHIYVLGVLMWPLSTVFMYTYMNAHFAGLIHAPQLKMTGLACFIEMDNINTTLPIKCGGVKLFV
jgi:hypothetical protein